MNEATFERLNERGGNVDKGRAEKKVTEPIGIAAEKKYGVTTCNDVIEIKVYVKRNGISRNGQTGQGDRGDRSVVMIGKGELNEGYKVGKNTPSDIGVLIINLPDIILIVAIYGRVIMNHRIDNHGKKNQAGEKIGTLEESNHDTKSRTLRRTTLNKPTETRTKKRELQ